MSIYFTKMQGLGNDFVVINAVAQSIHITSEWIRHIADRHYGVGCDQVLIISPASNPKADFTYRIFNADGAEVYQCGNGARCVGLYIRSKKLSDKKIIYLETQRNLIRVECRDNNHVLVDIAIPNFDPISLPYIPAQTLTLPFAVDVVSVGNPHCVLQVNSLTRDEMIFIGEQLNAHPAFPEGVNVGFMQCESRDRIQLTVYERGAGMTQACGSGACAAVAVGRKRGLLNETVLVHQAGGDVQVTWKSEDAMIQLCGPAVTVFEGVQH